MPELKLFVREREGLSLIQSPTSSVPAQDTISRAPCTSAQFSADGRYLALLSTSEVNIIDTDTGETICALSLPGVVAIAFSPKGTFLQAFQKPSGQGANLTVRHVGGGEPFLSFVQKSYARSNWPSIQISEDESVACRVVTSEVQFFNLASVESGVAGRLKVPGLAAAQLSPGLSSHVAVFVPESKGAPASVRIYERANASAAQAVAWRSFFRASSVRMLWNRMSSGVLVLAHSDVDKTNQSYYGDSSLHYLTTDASFEGSVPLSKEGPIHDVQWSPSGADFVVVHGFMPAKATLFDTQCQPLFDFGEGPKNLVRWSPNGSFVLLAGFGNLPGDMEFWDRGQLRLLGRTRGACSVTAEWSPDSSLLMTATTAPRLQVDNGYKLFKYDGTLLYEKSCAALYQAEWRPAPADSFPKVPPSPAGGPDTGQQPGVIAPRVSAPKKVAAPNIAPKPAAYRPPHALQRAAGSQPQSSAGAPESKVAAKNRKRREKEKARDSGGSPGGAPSSVPPDEVHALVEGVAQMPPPSAQDASPATSSGSENAKKLRALQKKLRQIEDLKAKVGAGGSEALSPAQREKLSQEATLRREIAALEILL